MRWVKRRRNRVFVAIAMTIPGALLLPVDATADSLLVTLVVDLGATRFADGLHAVAPQRSLVKLRERLGRATPRAALHKME